MTVFADIFVNGHLAIPYVFDLCKYTMKMKGEEISLG